MTDEEIPLAGGRGATGIVRVGDTVRRPLHRNSEFVHALLRHFETVGFDGAPRLLGLDEKGREILTFIEGRVFAGPEEVGDRVVLLADAQLASAGRLIRRFHDATAGTRFAREAEVVCHHDLGQHNMVFQGEEAVAIIDWDEDVAAGARSLDLSHAVWCLAEIGEQGGAVSEQADRVRVVCAAYGWEEPGVLIDELDTRFRRALAYAEENHLDGAIRIWSRVVAWFVEHGPELKAHL
jgi:hypothetical protein